MNDLFENDAARKLFESRGFRAWKKRTKTKWNWYRYFADSVRLNAWIQAQKNSACGAVKSN